MRAEIRFLWPFAAVNAPDGLVSIDTTEASCSTSRIAGPYSGSL
jgi:hypothetical protein